MENKEKNKTIVQTKLKKQEDVEVLKVASKILKEHKSAFEVLGNV